MIEELTKQLEDLQIKNDNLTKTDNKPNINWSKNKLITYCKEHNISGYSNCNKTKLLELIHSKQHNFINNISPLRYPGGKTKACNKLYDILTTYFDLSKFFETPRGMLDSEFTLAIDYFPDKYAFLS